MRNKITTSGTASLYRDAEVRTGQNGGKFVTLTFSTSSEWTDKASGEKKKRGPFWHRLVIFNKELAEYAATLKANETIEFHGGEVETRKWTKDGVENKATEFVFRWDCDINGYLASKTDSGSVASSAPAATAKAPECDDDMPF